MHHAVVALIVFGLAALTPASCARDPEADVAAIEGAFPLLGELRVEYLARGEGHLLDCQYIVYERGVFASDPDCSVVTQTADVRPIDAQAQRDMDRIAAAAASGGRTLRRAALGYGHADGAPSWGEFSYEAAVTYVFEPGWQTLPADGDGASFRAVDPDWYVESR